MYIFRELLARTLRDPNDYAPERVMPQCQWETILVHVIQAGCAGALAYLCPREGKSGESFAGASGFRSGLVCRFSCLWLRG